MNIKNSTDTNKVLYCFNKGSHEPELILELKTDKKQNDVPNTFDDYVITDLKLNNITYEEVAIVAKNMETYGGSFVKELSKAILRADDFNVRKIKSTFMVYWEKYRCMNKK